MLLEFQKTHLDAKTPTRSNPSDAGLDVYFCPEDGQFVDLRAGQNRILGTGLKFAIPHGYMLQVMNRSSMAAKKNLLVGAHCIDSGYAGEVFIDLHNVGSGNQIIRPGDKIAQLVMVPVMHVRVTLTGDELYDQDEPITISKRGDGALGSTGQ